MLRNSRWLVLLGLVGIGLAAGLAGSQPAAEPARTPRTPAEREKLVKPGKFGENGAADGRRGFFDSWNQQIIREDTPVSTVFMGDSITELWDLQVYFQSLPGEVIENRGMAKRFEADVLQLRPRNVVILGGINDLNYLTVKHTDPEKIFDQTVGGLEAMIHQAQKAGINVLVCSILPTNTKFHNHAALAALRAKVNERVKELCRENKCVYVDYEAALRDKDGRLRAELSEDGVHVQWAGYEIMARVLKEAAKANGLRL